MVENFARESSCLNLLLFFTGHSSKMLLLF